VTTDSPSPKSLRSLSKGGVRLAADRPPRELPCAFPAGPVVSSAGNLLENSTLEVSQPAYARPGALARLDLPALKGHPSALCAARTCPLPRVRLTWCSPIDFPITGAAYVGAEPAYACPDAHDNMLPPRHSSSRLSSPGSSSPRPSSSRPSSSRPSSSRPSSSRPSSSRPSSHTASQHTHDTPAHHAPAHHAPAHHAQLTTPQLITSQLVTPQFTTPQLIAPQLIRHHSAVHGGLRACF